MIRNSEKPEYPADWKSVGEVVLCSRLNDDMKRFVDEALKHNKSIKSLTQEAHVSMDSYITDANA